MENNNQQPVQPVQPINNTAVPLSQPMPPIAPQAPMAVPKPTTVEQFSAKSKVFFTKAKKPLLIAMLTVVVAIIGVVLFNTFYDFTKINWVEDYGDYSLQYASVGQIELKAEAFDKEEKTLDLTYTTQEGTVKVVNGIAYWSLPQKEGVYTIFAVAPSGKKIEKSITVVSTDDTRTDDLVENVAFAANTGKDKDTDADGLPDLYETEISKTDPLNADTDNDGLSDGNELEFGFDPLKADSRGDGLKDGERSVEYDINAQELGVDISIKGNGDIATTTIDTSKNTTFENMDGVLGTVYNFNTSGKIDSALVKIKYNVSDLDKKGLKEDSLTLYYFDEEKKQLEPVTTEIDKQNKTIAANLSHFSKYVIGSSDAKLAETGANVLFVIDNSVSMYSEQQMVDAGYPDSQGAVGNDIEFKRLSLTNNMIDTLSGNYKFAAAEFSGDYVTLNGFAENKDIVKDAVNSMKGYWHSDGSGTDIINALKEGIAEFKSAEDGNYLILLTDGTNTSGSLSSSKKSIISSAQAKNVKICAIGLGDKIDTEELSEIAKSTGCGYYNSINATVLDEIFSIVGAAINYNQIDTDGDGKTDGTIIADSGFVVTRDGFSFGNYQTKQSDDGNCFGMATFANLRYLGKLPQSLGPKEEKRLYFSGYVDLVSSGYNLKNTYFMADGNLYDYEIKDEAIKARIPYLPSDIREKIEDGVYYVNDKYYDKFSNIGITFDMKDYKGSIEGVKQYQSVGYLDVENEKFVKNGNSEDVQLLKAIWRLYIEQVHDIKDVKFYLDSDGGSDKAYTTLVGELNSGNPVIISLSGSKGGHAVNAVRLIQDNNDANKFKLQIYDNNHPGEYQYVEMARSKYTNIIKQWWDDNLDSEYYYTFMYDTLYGDEKINLSIQLLQNF